MDFSFKGRRKQQQAVVAEETISRNVWFAQGESAQLLFDCQKVYVGQYGDIELQFESELDLGIHEVLDDGFRPHKQHLRFHVKFVTEFYTLPDITILRKKSKAYCKMRATHITRTGFMLEIMVPPRDKKVPRKMHVAWRAAGTPATQVNLALDNVPIDIATLSPHTDSFLNDIDKDAAMNSRSWTAIMFLTEADQTEGMPEGLIPNHGICPIDFAIDQARMSGASKAVAVLFAEDETEHFDPRRTYGHLRSIQQRWWEVGFDLQVQTYTCLEGWLDHHVAAEGQWDIVKVPSPDVPSHGMETGLSDLASEFIVQPAEALQLTDKHRIDGNRLVA